MMAQEVINPTGGTQPTCANPAGGGNGLTTDASKPFYRRILENYISSRQAKHKASESPTENGTGPNTTDTAQPVQPAVPLSQEEISKMSKEALDTAYYEEIEREAEKAMRNPDRKLKWNRDVSPTDKEWTEQREKFQSLLAVNSVSDVLDAEIETAQKYLLIPPLEDGPLLQVQSENAKEYKALFEPGARFHGTRDNLATKLTMLKFGLPVEPVTLKNIERCGIPVDEDDPTDDPEPVPAIQRIVYADKPLEFLDYYSERSFGYPMLRSKCHFAAMLLAVN